MRIKEINLENFRSFSKIRIQLPQIPIIVIFDENGSGKTSLLEGIIFGLKGEIDSYNSMEYGSIDALYNLRQSDKKRISSSLIIEDENNSIIIEANRPKRKKTYLTKSAKFDISFRVNDKVKSLTEFKEICKEYLQIDYNTFPLANFLSQNIINDVLVSDAKLRANVFSKILTTDWINSIIDYSSANINSVRKKKRELENIWQQSKATLQNTELDSLYRQILDNVKYLQSIGIKLNNTDEVTAIDINSRLINISNNLELTEISNYFISDDLKTKDLNKTKREKFVKICLKEIGSFKVQIGIEKKHIDNMDNIISEMKSHVKSRAVANNMIQELDKKSKKIKTELDKIEKKNEDIDKKYRNQKELDEVIRSKLKEIKRIDGEIKRIDKKYGNKEKSDKVIANLNKKLSDKMNLSKKLDTILPDLNNFKSGYSDNLKNISIVEDDISKLEIEYPLSLLKDDVKYFHKEIIDIFDKIDIYYIKDNIVEFIDKTSDKSNNFEDLKDIINRIKEELNTIDSKLKIDELNKYIKMMNRKNKTEIKIKSSSDKLRIINLNVDKLKGKQKFLEKERYKLENKIKIEENYGDKTKINFIIIIISSILSLFGIFNLWFLISIIPALIFISLQFDLSEPLSRSALHQFVPLNKRTLKEIIEVQKIYDEIDLNDDKINELQVQQEFYSDTIKTESEFNNYSTPNWIDPTKTDFNEILESYKRFELLERKTQSLDKLIIRKNELWKLNDKISSLTKSNNILSKSINKLLKEADIPNEIIVNLDSNNLKSIKLTIQNLKKIQDKIQIEIRDLKTKIKEINDLMNSRKDFEFMRAEQLIYNDKIISYKDITELNKMMKKELITISKQRDNYVTTIKKLNKENNIISKDMSKQNGIVEAAKLSISRLLKELNLQKIPENIDEELKSIAKEKENEFNIKQNKLNKLKKLENEINHINDHLKRWDVIQSNWIKHQDTIEKTQNKIKKVEKLARKLNNMEASLIMINKIIAEENELYLRKMENDIIDDLMKYFENLGGHDEIDNLNFNFKMSRNKLNAQLSVGSNKFKGAPKALYSNGQQVSLVLALFMATSKINNLNSHFKWIGFDEPTQFLDTNRKRNFIKTLKIFFNDLKSPQIVISTADKEFIDLIIQDNTGEIEIFNMQKLKEYSTKENYKPKLDFNKIKIIEDEAIKDIIPIIPDDDKYDVFGSNIPDEARSDKVITDNKIFAGKTNTCGICKNEFQSATYSKTCGNKDCLNTLKERWFS